MNIKASCLSLAAIAVMLAFPAHADSKRYNVSLRYAAAAGTQQLEPGEYKLEMSDTSKVTMTHGGSGESVELNVTVETGEQKHKATAIHFEGADGTRRITEINLGGTKLTVKFPS